MEIKLEKERVDFDSSVENANTLDKSFQSTSQFWKNQRQISKFV